tara:strand:+ start:483 stop:662 length:180 start_codon:yes stop_codon:yes gene_type:complete
MQLKHLKRVFETNTITGIDVEAGNPKTVFLFIKNTFSGKEGSIDLLTVLQTILDCDLQP